MHKLHLSWLLAGLLFAVGPMILLAQDGFDTLPDLGDASGQTLSPQQDRALGSAFMRSIRQQGLVLEDAEATRYIRNLGRRLSMHSENPGHGFTFFLVDDPRINAFAGPAGYIGTNVGLFVAADTESELAGVLAHEIAHVTQRHLARAFDAAKRNSLRNTAALLAAILIGTQDSQAGAAAITAASAYNVQEQINFTRANEKEADRVGIHTLAESGFDPYGMPHFFEKLQKNAKLYGTQPPEFLSTHPVTTNRIAEAEARAEGYPAVKRDSELQFQLMRAKLRVASYENPRQVLADFRRFHGKSGGKSVAERYEYAMLLAAAKEYETAIDVMRALHRADPDRLSYRLALADILQQAGQLKASLSLYRSSLELYPGEAVLIRPYARALLSAEQNERAYQLLTGISSGTSDDPELYKLLAQAARKTARPLETHTAMSEYYYLNGYTREALEQIRLARKTPGLSDYQAARIEARMAALKQETEKED